MLGFEGRKTHRCCRTSISILQPTASQEWVSYVCDRAMPDVPDPPNQRLKYPLVRHHLVIGCRQDNDSKRKPGNVVLEFETLVDCDENVKPAHNILS